MASDGLRIRLLGELELLRDGKAAKLPASRKTRALLGYLIATADTHRRERLCDLLWDGPDDPRAELRWSLSRIRPLLDDAGAIRLRADRERIAFEAGGAAIDLRAVQGLLKGGIAATPTDALRAAVGLFRGEFLDGLDLPGCYRFHAWCLAEREAASATRLALLGALVERLDDDPEEALGHARALVAADPLSEAGHAAVVRLLGRLGRRRDALAHHDHARGVLLAEFGAASGELERARRALASRPVAAPPVVQDMPHGAGDEPSVEVTMPPLVGRAAERSLLDAEVAAAVDGHARRVLLLTGEPGIGKSRLLAHLAERMALVGGRVLGGRAFEAEVGRPFGIWIDALRAVPAAEVPEALRLDLAPLRPGACPGAPAGERTPDRSRLFDAVVALLRHLVARRPAVLLLDDVQWLDEASASLLHFVLREGAMASRLLIACAARPGELEDNAAASRVVLAQQRAERLTEMPLGPLDMAETQELVRAVAPVLDAAPVFADSAGNPFLALELARAGRDGTAQPGQTTRALDAVIAGQLARLTPGARDLLAWAAALGRACDPELLGQASGIAAPELATLIEELERRGILRAGTEDCDFVHDLLRQAVYRTISQPRRRLLHRRIARLLEAASGSDDSAAGELARHAALCGDDAMALRACILAGERCLRLFAQAEAGGFADRGLWHLDRLSSPGPDAAEARIGLLRIRVLAGTGPGLRRVPDLADAVARATAAAEADGAATAAATGHYLLSVLHQQAGDADGARESTVRAAAAGRGAADLRVHARQLANTARCLLELETEVEQAGALLDEAQVLASSLGLEMCELDWGLGLLARRNGRLVDAAPFMRRALALARRSADRWREYKCLTWLAVVSLEEGRLAEVESLCTEISEVAARMGEDAPFAEALGALAALRADAPGAEGRLDAAIARLRAVDDKGYLAYALNAAAGHHLSAGRVEAAQAAAAEALSAAAAVGRGGEAAAARATLARAAAAGSAIPTVAPTPAGQAAARPRTRRR
ncbi:AAA family ATPase [Roseomonas sp. HF4]|uniref:ATP-binding protein n=1 Tax=Roseomonas sp. HF4 TaxID=2562313 RepID=UPI0010C11CD0|nr:AAA family ATPase [Roseomonas sp. HF4]